MRQLKSTKGDTMSDDDRKILEDLAAGTSAPHDLVPLLRLMARAILDLRSETNE
jgi:hypothetical protein